MRKSATEQLTKIRAAVTGGKSFADAAKEAGLETKTVGPVTASYRPTTGDAPADLFQAACTADPGTVVDLVSEPAQSFIVFVEKREVTKQPDGAPGADAQVKSVENQNQYAALASWLAERLEAAKVEALYKKR